MGIKPIVQSLAALHDRVPHIKLFHGGDNGHIPADELDFRRASRRLGTLRTGRRRWSWPLGSDVRFTPESRHFQRRLRCPLSAKSRHSASARLDGIISFARKPRIIIIAATDR